MARWLSTLAAIMLSIALFTTSYFSAEAVTWTTTSARLEHYVVNSDRIMTGVVTDKETVGDTELVWIGVYNWLKNEVSNSEQIILDQQSPASGSNVEFDIGEEVLLPLVDVDLVNGHFGLYYPVFDFPSKFPITIKDEVVAIIEKHPDTRTRQQIEDEELERLLNQSASENCKITTIQWTSEGEDDKFLYCTYEEEYMQFYVPISVTLEKVKQQLLGHVSAEYFVEHFDLRRAYDEAVINGEATPVGQTLDLEYTVDNITLSYSVRVSLGYEENDRNILYVSYSPPKEIDHFAIRDLKQIDNLVYSSCLDPGTPYVLYDALAASHTDRGFSGVIGGSGPPDVFDRYGNEFQEAEKRFLVWFDTGEILCTDKVKEDDVIDQSLARQEKVILMNASDYIPQSVANPIPGNSSPMQMPVLIGIGAAIAGVIAFITIRRTRK
jgi:hypothetical protein